ncbi:hypothetical protein HK099_005777 [Clydaea vesicula]|uniref:Cache domain-containing protein n=1 Tax=Clydaea vesicula TaxID=447962 RepID=A0AAD5TYN0_9FUNG|nr:hypothetical protein HK099_005777 [Clydaea vesicula]KAJ3383482.1 hypothetical protein HDU92_004098 [Lobulomyces angularis]
MNSLINSNGVSFEQNVDHEKENLTTRKYKKVKTVSVSVVVFFQNLFIVFLIVLPLLLTSLHTLNETDELTFNYGKSISNILSNEIQKDQSTIIDSQIKKILNEKLSLLMDFSRVSSIGMLNFQDFDLIYEYFWKLQMDSGPLPAVYIGFNNGNFMAIKSTLNVNGTVSYFLNLQLPERANLICKICSSETVMNNASLKYSFLIDSATSKPLEMYESVVEYNIFERPWWKMGKDNSDIAISDPYPFTQQGSAGFSLVKGNFSANSNFNYVVTAIDIRFETLSLDIQNFLKTANTFIYAMVSNGEIVGSTYNGSLLSDDGLRLKKPAEIPDEHIKNSGNFIKKLLNGNSDWSTLGKYQCYSLDDVLFQYSVIDVKNIKFVIITGAPINDYLGNFQALKQQMMDSLSNNRNYIILLSLGVFLIFVTLSLFATYYLIVAPLKEISSIMEQATKFDFSALKENNLMSNRSKITEFALVQSSFFTMIKNFAQSLQANNLLSRRGSLHSSHQQVNNNQLAALPKKDPLQNDSETSILNESEF